MPEEFKKEVLDEKLKSISLTSDEELLLFKTYKSKKDMYRLKSNDVDTKVMRNLRELNKKLNITSAKSIEKSEFAYRVLSDNQILDKLYNSQMFIWSLENNDISKNIDKVYISKYISKFLNYKIKYDNENIKKLIQKHINMTLANELLNKEEYAKTIGLRLANTECLVDRYIDLLGIEL